MLGVKTIGEAGGVRIRQVVTCLSPSMETPVLGDEGEVVPDLPTPCKSILLGSEIFLKRDVLHLPVLAIQSQVNLLKCQGKPRKL